MVWLKVCMVVMVHNIIVEVVNAGGSRNINFVDLVV